MPPTVLSEFRDNVESVYSLAHFDRIVVDVALNRLRTVEAKIIRNAGIDNERYSLLPAITHLENIRENDSTRLRYESMFNQCVVLLVSYFESATRQLFRESLSAILTTDLAPSRLLNEKLTLTVAELAESDTSGTSQLADFFVAKRDPSFSDMRSIREAFRVYLDVDPGRDELTNTVIFAQAARHAIVHAGARADERFMHQIRDAAPRRIQPGVSRGDSLSFSEDEISVIGDSMVQFMQRLSESAA